MIRYLSELVIQSSILSVPRTPRRSPRRSPSKTGRLVVFLFFRAPAGACRRRPGDYYQAQVPRTAQACRRQWREEPRPRSLGCSSKNIQAPLASGQAAWAAQALLARAQVLTPLTQAHPQQTFAPPPPPLLLPPCRQEQIRPPPPPPPLPPSGSRSAQTRHSLYTIRTFIRYIHIST